MIWNNLDFELRLGTLDLFTAAVHFYAVTTRLFFRQRAFYYYILCLVRERPLPERTERDLGARDAWKFGKDGGEVALFDGAQFVLQLFRIKFPDQIRRPFERK